MRVTCRNAVLGAAAFAMLLAFGTTAQAAAPNKCLAGKIGCVSKKKSCLLGVYGKGEKKGLAPDAAKLQKCKDKFDGGTAPAKGCFAKLEAKNDGPCLTTGDTSTQEAKIDAFVADVITELDPGFPTPSLNKCTAGKNKCVANKDKCILGVNAKAAKTGLPPDAAKLQKCKDKFDGGLVPSKGCFAKLEAKGGCATLSDTAALEAKADAFDADVLAELNPVPSCPTKIQFTGTSTNGVLDTGWTGNGHDATTISDGTVTVSVTSCDNAVPPCGVCTYSGPITNFIGQLRVHRCQGDSSIICTVDGDCGANAPCKFFFGSYLPLAAGGVSTCVENVFNGGISGTANINTSGVGAGTSAGTASVTSIVFSGPTLSNPCPNCIGDAIANDNVAGGTCSAGLHAGAACDASGSSPNASFGTTSLDCPPLAGGKIAALPINLDNTTGTKTRTTTAANPLCRAPGWGALHCQCDTCDNAAATPCSSNADCGGGICGGKRCASGANVGTPCAANSECPSSACTTPGAATAAHQCDGGPGSGDCVADAGTPSPNDRICSSGPFETFCGPVETFRGCSSDGDCPFSGDTCSVGRFRDCFDNGVLAETIKSTGQADPPSGHQSDSDPRGDVLRRADVVVVGQLGGRSPWSRTSRAPGSLRRQRQPVRVNDLNPRGGSPPWGRFEAPGVTRRPGLFFSALPLWSNFLSFDTLRHEEPWHLRHFFVDIRVNASASCISCSVPDHFSRAANDPCRSPSIANVRDVPTTALRRRSR